MSETCYWAVVPAAGIGRRMGSAIPKQYLPLAGLNLIVHALDTLLSYPRMSGVIVVVSGDDQWWDSIRLETGKPLLRVTGGPERCHSVLNGLYALKAQAQPNDWVLVHDAARPCLRTSDLDTLIDTLVDDPVGGLLATPVRDTIKRSDAQGRISATVDRQGLWHALTPQMFRFGVLLSALQRAIEQNLRITDDASAVEAMGFAPRLVEGRPDNIKVTCPEDLILAEFYLKQFQGVNDRG
jgi:2-C-methyl-D-erythritol 4-phosphate cytidylyltransferase